MWAIWAWWPSQRLTLKSGHQERSRSHSRAHAQLIVYRKCNLVMTAKRSLSFLLSFKRERAVFQDLTFSILSTRDPRQHHRIKKKTLGARRLFPLLRRALTSGLFCDPMLTMVSILWKGFLSSNASIICRPLFFFIDGRHARISLDGQKLLKSPSKEKKERKEK